MSKSSELHIEKLRLLSHTERKRAHFRYKVRECLKTLKEEEFLRCVKECLHSNHYPILVEYIKVSEELYQLVYNKVNLLEETSCLKAKIKSLKYLCKSHRKSLTCAMTELVPDGYSSELLEYLVIYNFWAR
jgi:hypothetical protein